MEGGENQPSTSRSGPQRPLSPVKSTGKGMCEVHSWWRLSRLPMGRARWPAIPEEEEEEEEESLGRWSRTHLLMRPQVLSLSLAPEAPAWAGAVPRTWGWFMARRLLALPGILRFSSTPFQPGFAPGNDTETVLGWLRRSPPAAGQRSGARDSFRSAGSL